MTYINRRIDTYLTRWKESADRKPLLLRGARQVGKTSSVRHLGASFDYYVEVDLNERHALHALFEGDYTPQQICSQLSAIVGVPIVEGQTLLFIDEIQACPAAIGKLRYFYERMPKLHLIAAGSLLEFALTTLPSFGVARIRSLFMYPFSFSEFLGAMNMDALAQAIAAATPAKGLPDALHDAAVKQLRTFIVTGGMPESVATYAAGGDLMTCQQVLNDLVLSYYDDFKKYSARLSPALIREVFTSVALQGQGKFVYSRVTDAKRVQVKQALDMLSMAGLIYPVVHTDSNGLPLFAEANEKYRRYIYIDTGLLQRSLGLDLADILLANDMKTVNRGAIAETFVGTELVKNTSPYNHNSLFCWHREHKDAQAEVDYVIARNGIVCPVEVKSGTRGSMQSMRIFLSSKGLQRGIRTSLENFSAYDDVDVYPLYAIGNAVNSHD